MDLRKIKKLIASSGESREVLSDAFAASPVAASPVFTGFMVSGSSMVSSAAKPLNM
jgi:hypothetical protein